MGPNTLQGPWALWRRHLNFVKRQGTIVDKTFRGLFLPDSWLKWITWLLFYTDKKFLIFIFFAILCLNVLLLKSLHRVFKFHDGVDWQRETLFCLFLFALYNVSVTAYTKADTLGFSPLKLRFFWHSTALALIKPTASIKDIVLSATY